MEKLQLLKIVGLVVGCFAKFVTGSLFVFSVYQDAIKLTFNYTQKEVELFSSMLNLGLGVGFLPGMFYDRYGPQMTSACGLVVSVSSYMLIWSTTKSVKFYSNNSWLMAVYFFICGFGSAFTYMVALNTNIINFDKRWTGSVVGLLNGFLAGSPSIYSVLYYHLFAHGDTTDPHNQDFPGFMIMFAISFGIVDIMCILFLKVYPDESPTFVKFEDEQTENTSTNNGLKETLDQINTVANKTQSKNPENTDTLENDERELNSIRRNDKYLDSTVKRVNEASLSNEVDLSVAPMDLKDLLKNVDYHMILWSFAFASCIGLVYVNNITVISKSMGLDRYNDRLTIIIPISNGVFSTGVGYLSDRLKDRLPRAWLLVLAFVALVGSQVITLLFAYNLTALVFSTIAVGFGIAVIWSITPTILKEMFYVGNLGRNWGMAILVAAVLGLCTQEVYGTVYDSEIQGNDTFCYGMKCIRVGTALCVAISSVPVVLGMLLIFKKACLRRYRTIGKVNTDNQP